MHENKWMKPDHVHQYLERAGTIPHRTEGEAVLVEHLPPQAGRVLDLGTGNGRLAAIVLDARPRCDVVAVDFSPAMLDSARERFAADARVEVAEHDLDDSLPAAWGRFDAVVSSFAIHHVSDVRKAALYAEVATHLHAGGAFLNLEHVSSPTEALHREFMQAMGSTTEDPSNHLASVDDNLEWMREAGLVDVDCAWKWRELALLVGRKPQA